MLKEQIQELLKKSNYAFDEEKWKSIENVSFLLNAETTQQLNRIKKNMGVTKGIYIFSDSNKKILYIGKGAPIYNRIRRHFAKLKNFSSSNHQMNSLQDIPAFITIHWVEIEQPDTREIVEHMLAYTLKPAFKKWYIT